MEKTIEHNGINWKLEQLSPESWSLVCLTPNFDNEGIDYTQWPEDETVSEWAGQDLSFFDQGDDPEHPEGIYFIK